MPFFKCKLRDEDVADATVVEAETPERAARWYGRRAQARDHEGRDGYPHDTYDVAIYAPGERAQLFRVTLLGRQVRIVKLTN